MGLVVGFGSKNVGNYDPIASTIGFGPSNKFGNFLSSVGMISLRKEIIPKNERWLIAQ